MDISRERSYRPGPDLWTTVLRVAWLSVLLGLLLEIVLLGLVTAFGQASGVKPFVADLIQKIAWSFLVCVGLALGTAASNARAAAMGLLGLLAAPIAFYIVRSLHKGVLEALAITGSALSGPPPFLLAMIKGAEYGLLGMAIGWVGQRPSGGVAMHASIGLAVGVLFGGPILVLIAHYHPEALPLALILGQGVNEVLFPVGCSVALYVANTLAARTGR